MFIKYNRMPNKKSNKRKGLRKRKSKKQKGGEGIMARVANFFGKPKTPVITDDKPQGSSTTPPDCSAKVSEINALKDAEQKIKDQLHQCEGDLKTCKSKAQSPGPGGPPGPGVPPGGVEGTVKQSGTEVPPGTEVQPGAGEGGKKRKTRKKRGKKRPNCS